MLAEIRTSQLTDSDRARFAFLRASNMLWALADPARAKETHRRRVAHHTAAGSQLYRRLPHGVLVCDGPAGLRRCRLRKTLRWKTCPVVGAEIAWALAAIAADAGRTTEAVAVADAGYTVATRSLDAPHMRFNIADAACQRTAAGRPGYGRARGGRAHAPAGSRSPGAAQLLGAAVAGRAALGAGHLHIACSAAGTGSRRVVRVGPSHRLGVPLSRPTNDGARDAWLTRRGSRRACRAGQACNADSGRWTMSVSLARAWVAAGQGAVSEAITIVLSAAERAAATGRFAAEVLCLQTATQFGDRTSAPRLRELESVVEGPRVGLAARFAAALRDGDAAELSSLSEEFESMGDLVAAVDAAAHAALAYRRQDKRGSALGCSTRADALAAQCGASTPALRQATESLPLTDREAEIVMLIGEGLSNRAVAERLTLSIRTVESHIYRAMMKTGTTSRDELAALLPRHKARTE